MPTTSVKLTENTANMTAELNRTRQHLLTLVNDIFNGLINKLENPNAVKSEASTELTIPLTANPNILIGKKAVAVVIGETRIPIKTWREAFKEIMSHCLQNPVYYDRLLGLRGRIAGKERVFVSGKPDTMKRPLRIGEDFYFETHYGTETLMHILVNRILAAIRYDCSAITIVFKAQNGGQK